MMQPKTRVEELLHQLGTSVIAVEEPERAAARRERIVPHLAQFTRDLCIRRRRDRYRARVAAVAVSAAALLAVTIGYHARRSPPNVGVASTDGAPSVLLALRGSVQLVRQASETGAPPLQHVEVGTSDEVVTGEGALARATLPSGADIEIGPQSKIRLAGAWGSRQTGREEKKEGSSIRGGDEAVVLSAGRVSVRVPKLGPDRTFSVETPEATVIVHGTAFSVERREATEGAAMSTRVEVQQGSVAVRHHGVEVLLAAGDHWTSAPSDAAPDPNSTTSDPELGSARQKSAERAPRSGSTPTGAATRGEFAFDKKSTLAAENRLLKAAMAARQHGNPQRAVQLASELLSRYPDSPLVEEARVERVRALVATGVRAAADSEARAYLTDYPQGFARQEVARILAGVAR